MRSMVFGESPHHSSLIKSYVFDQVSGTEVAIGSQWLTEVFHTLDIRSVLLLSLETKKQRWDVPFTYRYLKVSNITRAYFLSEQQQNMAARYVHSSGRAAETA
jgi:hypothetical protein